MAWSWWENFDKRLLGKWISEKFIINTTPVIIFINVKKEEDTENVKVELNYFKALFNSSAFYTEYSYDSLYFFHNDIRHRAEYNLRFGDEDNINCSFSIKNCFGLQGEFKTEIKFLRLSEEEENKYKYIVELKNLNYSETLKQYAKYGNIRKDIPHTYSFDERGNMTDIIEKYNLDKLVENKSETDAAVTLLNWFCGLYSHGDIGLAQTRTPQALMKFADANGGKTNCRGLAIILAHILRAYSIKAFHITCLPFEEPCEECHVVVCAFCDNINKWIMLDPSSNLYIKNKSGEILGLDEFREALICGDEISTNEESKERCVNYSEYMSKNLIRLRRGTTQRYGCDETDGSIVLIPQKYMDEEAAKFDNNERSIFITSKEDFWKI